MVLQEEGKQEGEEGEGERRPSANKPKPPIVSRKPKRPEEPGRAAGPEKKMPLTPPTAAPRLKMQEGNGGSEGKKSPPLVASKSPPVVAAKPKRPSARNLAQSPDKKMTSEEVCGTLIICKYCMYHSTCGDAIVSTEQARAGLDNREDRKWREGEEGGSR